MKKNEIIKTSKLNTENIHSNQYTLSLLNEGLLSGVFPQSFVEQTQMDIIHTLNDYIDQYTCGQSASVKTETAQNLLSSLLYQADFYLLGAKNHDKASAMLKAQSIREICQKGLALIENEINTCRKLLAQIQKNNIHVNLIAYNDTINEALTDFFKNYDPRFGAHDTMAGIDYPLALDNQSLSGISYIRNYLETIQTENAFCLRFSSQTLREILNGYGQIYHTDYRHLLVNLFELVLTNAIFAAVLEKPAKNILLSQAECDQIIQTFKDSPRFKHPAILQKAVDRIIFQWQITEPALLEYIKKCQKYILPKIIKSQEQNSLYPLMIKKQKAYQTPQIPLTEEKKLSDADFSSLVDSLLQCKDKKSKVNRILCSVQCLRDFIDILNADCLFGDEYTMLFDSLDDTAFTLLAAKIFEDDILAEPHTFSFVTADAPQYESEGENRFLSYFNNTGQSRKARMDLCLKNLL